MVWCNSHLPHYILVNEHLRKRSFCVSQWLFFFGEQLLTWILKTSLAKKIVPHRTNNSVVSWWFSRPMIGISCKINVNYWINLVLTKRILKTKQFLEITVSLLLGDRRCFFFWKSIPSISIWQQLINSWSFLWQFDYSFYSIPGHQRLCRFFYFGSTNSTSKYCPHPTHQQKKQTNKKRFQKPFTCRKSKISWSLSHNNLFRQWHQWIKTNSQKTR